MWKAEIQLSHLARYRATADTSSAPASPGDKLARGTVVRITGLQTRPELNGLVGRILDFDEGKQRYSVELSILSTLQLKPANLNVISPSAAPASEEKKWSNFKTYPTDRKLTESELHEFGIWLKSMSLEKMITKNLSDLEQTFPIFVNMYIKYQTLKQQLQDILYKTYSAQALEEMSKIIWTHKGKKYEEWYSEIMDTVPVVPIFTKIVRLSKLIPLEMMRSTETEKGKPIHSLIKFYIHNLDVKEELLATIFNESGASSDSDTDDEADTTKGNYEICESFKKECEDVIPPITDAKRCFHTLSKKYHPDRNVSSDATQKMQSLVSCFTDEKTSWNHI